MNRSPSKNRPTTMDLPECAPLVRVTAGGGSPAQKTWNLRRPVTLIGSRRPASIVLHDQGAAKAHCVIVQTGADVLLKDLQSPGGTKLNQQPVDLAVLSDGDVITIGENTILVAIQQPRNGADDSGYGHEFIEPTKFAQPVAIALEHTEHRWLITDAVALVGRSEKADIRLDHPNVSARQAILFQFANGPAFFDLVGKGELSLNGDSNGLFVAGSGDRIGVGPLTLSLDNAGRAYTFSEPSPAMSETPAAPKQQTPRWTAPDAAMNSSPAPAEATQKKALSKIEDELAALEKNIAESWQRLNAFDSPSSETSKLQQRQSDLAARDAALDAKDALIRGQMHDVGKFHEQLHAREHELAVQVSCLQVEKDKTASFQKAMERQAADLVQKHEELMRREHVLAQRWTRLQSAVCGHCHKPINVGQFGHAES